MNVVKPSLKVLALAVAVVGCKAGGSEPRPVERAVIDVPRPQPVATEDHRPLPERPPVPTAPSELEREVADIMNAFSKTSQCPDFDYFPDGGYQNFWCHRPTSLTIQSLETRAGVPIFLSGPHGGGAFNSHSKNDFGHYNPAFVRWLGDEVVPKSKNGKTVRATQGMYDAMMKPLATIFYLTSQKVRREPVCFERERDGYKKLLGQKKLPEGYHERWFFFMNQEFCVRMARGQTSDQYFYQHGMDGGVDGNVVKGVLGFFVRRSLDGTLADFERALDRTIAAYQPDLLQGP
jgi:hypothetical protein